MATGAPEYSSPEWSLEFWLRTRIVHLNPCWRLFFSGLAGDCR
jgi:hypothetical protein